MGIPPEQVAHAHTCMHGFRICCDKNMILVASYSLFPPPVHHHRIRGYKVIILLVHGSIGEICQSQSVVENYVSCLLSECHIISHGIRLSGFPSISLLSKLS